MQFYQFILDLHYGFSSLCALPVQLILKFFYSWTVAIKLFEHAGTIVIFFSTWKWDNLQLTSDSLDNFRVL